MGTLSTQAVLKGIGVGNEYATPLAATITWLIRGKGPTFLHICLTSIRALRENAFVDGTSHVARIWFTWYERLVSLQMMTSNILKIIHMDLLSLKRSFWF